MKVIVISSSMFDAGRPTISENENIVAFRTTQIDHVNPIMALLNKSNFC
jgi:hypothetical protein